MRPRWLIPVCLLIWLWSLPLAAQDHRAPIHVQIVLDSSGSMVDNDPGRLSSLAGMIFSDLAGPGDSVGILSMRAGKFVEEPIGAIGERRKKVRDSVKSLPFLGSTFCAEPLEAAAAGLARMRTKQPKARQFVVFLSDGVCPEGQPEAVREAARQLGTAGVKVFSIGLFGDGPGDPTADLRAMAALTDGEFFSATQASDLPQRFASILGRIVGSEAQTITIEPGADVMATLDGYVYDASLIITGSRTPIVVTKAEGPVDTKLDLPRRAPYAVTSPNFHIAAFSNNRGSHYSVLRIEEPAAGNWTFQVDGPADMQALLIQNYALDPVVEFANPRPVYALGESCELKAWLRGKGDAKISDPKFLAKVEFTVTLADPSGKEHALVLKPGADGTFAGAQKLDVPGKWTVRGRARMKSGGLDKRTALRRFEVRAATLALAPNHPPIDLGSVDAGSTTKPFTIDLTGSEFPAADELALRLEGAPGIRHTPGSMKIGPNSKTGEVTFTIETDHPGGPVSGKLLIDMHGTTVALPVTGTVVPLSFWERWGRLIITIGVGLLLLLLVLFVLYGFVSPHAFPADARLNWGESLDRLKKNEILIREIQGTGKGFYKNARLVVGGPGSFLPADGAVLAEIAVAGAAQIVIRSPNVPLHKVNKFDDSKTKAVDGNETAMHSGEIYQVGKLYLRLR